MAFAREYLTDLNAGAAYKRTHPKYRGKNHHQLGYQQLQKPSVQRAIKKLNAERTERTNITTDMVLAELWKLATSDIRQVFDERGNMLDIHQIPDEVAAVLSGVEISDWKTLDQGEVQERLKKLKLWDKVACLRIVAQHLGMLSDKVEVEGSVTIVVETGVPRTPED
jgi:phage terminase small subunit